MSCFSLLGSFRIKPRLSCILAGDLHTVGVIGLSLPKAQHMLLPITLIGISSADSTGQMYIIHNHFNANMQGWERKYVTKKEAAISVPFWFSPSLTVSLLSPHLPAHIAKHSLHFWRGSGLLSLWKVSRFFVGSVWDVKYQHCTFSKGSACCILSVCGSNIFFVVASLTFFGKAHPNNYCITYFFCCQILLCMLTMTCVCNKWSFLIITRSPFSSTDEEYFCVLCVGSLPLCFSAV